MTNEQAKREAIKKAYGPLYDKCLPDNQGWTTYKAYRIIHNGRHFENFGLNREDVVVEYDYSNPPNLRWMPKMLFGLHDNNGWIRIEPDGSNLPKSGEYRWLFDSGNMADFYYEPGDIMSVKCTHYKPITPEKPPVY